MLPCIALFSGQHLDGKFVVTYSDDYSPDYPLTTPLDAACRPSNNPQNEILLRPLGS